MAKKSAYKPKFTEPEAPVLESGEQSPAAEVPQGRPPKGISKLRHEMSKVTTDGDIIDIWERRILNPSEQSSPLIQVRTKGMRLRWVNLTSRGRYQRAKHQGWVPVEQDELVDAREIYGVSYTTEGYVCRGERQQEMLMKMPDAVFKKIQARKGELTRKSYEKLRDAMASAGARHFGDKYNNTAGEQAADAAGRFKGSIEFGTEQASAAELLE